MLVSNCVGEFQANTSTSQYLYILDLLLQFQLYGSIGIASPFGPKSIFLSFPHFSSAYKQQNSPHSCCWRLCLARSAGRGMGSPEDNQIHLPFPCWMRWGNFLFFPVQELPLNPKKNKLLPWRDVLYKVIVSTDRDSKRTQQENGLDLLSWLKVTPSRQYVYWPQNWY